MCVQNNETLGPVTNKITDAFGYSLRHVDSSSLGVVSRLTQFWPGLYRQLTRGLGTHPAFVSPDETLLGLIISEASVSRRARQSSSNPFVPMFLLLLVKLSPPSLLMPPRQGFDSREGQRFFLFSTRSVAMLHPARLCTQAVLVTLIRLGEGKLAVA
jgi:hypothetical protein